MAKKRNAAPTASNRTANKASLDLLVKRKATAEYNDIVNKGGDLTGMVKQVVAAEDGFLAAKKKSMMAEAVSLLSQKIALEQATVSENLRASDFKEETKAKKVDRAADKAARAKAARAKAKAAVKATLRTDDTAKSEAAAEAVRLFEVVLRTGVQAKNLSDRTIRLIESYYVKAKAAVMALPVASQARIDLFNRFVQLTRVFRELKVPEGNRDSGGLLYGPEGQPAPVAKLPVPKPKPPGAPETEVNRRRSMRDRLTGTGKRLSSKFTDIQRVLGLVGSRDYSTGLRTRDTVYDFAGTTGKVGAYTAQSIARVGSGLKEIGKAIGASGTQTMKWVGSRISDLKKHLFRALGMFRNAMGTSNGPGDWLAIGAIGAIASSVLPPLIDRFVSYMKANYGESWFTGFIETKWTEAKKGIMEWLYKCIDTAVTTIKNLPERIAETAAAVKDDIAWRVKGWMDPSNKTAEYNDVVMAAENKGLTPKQKIIQRIETARNAKTASDKADAESNIVALLRSYPYILKDASIMKAITSLGITLGVDSKGKAISVSNSNSIVTKPVSVTNPSANTTNVTVPGAAPARSGAPTSVPSPKSAPIGSSSPDAPVVSPAPGGGDSNMPSSGQDQVVGSAGTAGLSNSLIPNQGVSDTLAFINFQGLNIA